VRAEEKHDLYVLNPCSKILVILSKERGEKNDA